ncbi:hypothetical protein PSN45_001295 [Yamadazyma tenuis]|uniref:2-dehydropantolactone reductase n=1 Tax=Candida tenuis (strain ATCC 10573 / BCRC 21748 / CBS 615 / JCM 9827 / NBRC 10315 / NRRL Y-1498 / VKM Y-70) TaxID=590646 RepID=G3BD38_CANTC|nr:Aldo/keto reductase [Yamadazyma tenuis ATCC 10573]XP_006690513.1 uncharacterized protein CANTEDRAFT_116956 [Yamadazyma tenuis ATCC 10573]EGV61298.1 Aldo/keto reductase [Yamadazyma tenuis ATCC 10573]EGV61299.1 hypothetical protein CANTEDRAFT_116956 [Yamadazyma tenuis ATCC 10573]WEJ93819.1 hypothetical protein PSN45_001295 [Yamadazyma tenuis]
MTTITLNNGTTIPQLGLGVFLTPQDVAKPTVYSALDIGYRHIDSASKYGNEQQVCEGIAQWLKDNNQSRKSVFYTTKIWNSDHGYQACKKAIEVCLKNASSIGYIDLVLVHSPLSNAEKRHGTWLALQEAVDAGTVKNIGVSNYGVAHLQELLAYSDLKYKPVINQVEIHPWLTREELVQFCRENEIAVEAYSPLARGKNFGDEYIVQLSKKYNVTEAQIMIKWSLAKGYIPLPKTVNQDRLVSNFDVYSFELTKDEIAQLDAKDVYGITGWDPTKFPLDADADAD